MYRRKDAGCLEMCGGERHGPMSQQLVGAISQRRIVDSPQRMTDSKRWGTVALTNGALGSSGVTTARVVGAVRRGASRWRYLVLARHP